MLLQWLLLHSHHTMGWRGAHFARYGREWGQNVRNGSLRARHFGGYGRGGAQKFTDGVKNVQGGKWSGRQFGR